ncbi:hypothetical protein SAMN05216483_0934 [Streptomyces sp. 2131.1]|uniref:hypothetical protein n=1 Tax=Streptomyces sp. 2131.1 TaxID=1855346 RepID=UPI000898E96D|nr:hypothetical protein [Streptomyces sp. 2131.1]SEC04026.1 hypothetical protein SAMN05216483_0934 [Streptomyces sp. 2131.1]
MTADTPLEAAAGHHHAQAVLCRIQGRYEDALPAAEQALAAALRVPGRPGEGLLARVHSLRAGVLGLTGRLDEAHEAADLAPAPAEACGDPTLLGQVLSTLRENERRGGRLREAVATGQRALDLVEQSGDQAGAAFERANLAELWLLLQEFATARTLAEAAVVGAEQDDAWCLPYALAALALVRMRTGDARAAAVPLDRARSSPGLVDRQAGHEVRAARAELALRDGLPGHARRALEGHERAVPVLAAWAELQSGRPAPARRLAADEAARTARTGERIAEADARTVLALALFRLGDDTAAREALHQAETLAAALPYPAGTAHAAEVRRLMETEPHNP